MNQQDIWDELERNRPPLTLEEEMFELISAYLDGECSLKEQKIVEAYLAENPRALHLFEELQAIRNLWVPSEVPPPPTLREAIWNSTTRRPPKLLRPYRLAWALGMGTFVLLSGLWFLQGIQKPSNPSPRENSFVSSAPLKPPISLPQPAPAFVALQGTSKGSSRPNPAKTFRGAQTNLESPSPVPPAGSAPILVASNPPLKGASSAPPGPSAPPTSIESLPEISPPPSKPAPEVPDLVALSFPDEGENQEVLSPPTKSASPASSPNSLSPEARNRLRKRLAEVNSGEDELREAVKSGNHRSR
jgi:hypothetical protein